MHKAGCGRSGLYLSSLPAPVWLSVGEHQGLGSSLEEQSQFYLAEATLVETSSLGILLEWSSAADWSIDISGAN